MSIDTTTAEQPTSGDAPSKVPARRLRRLLIGAVALPLALGVAGLSLAQSGTAPAPAPTMLAPTAVGSLTTSRDIAAKGEVAEIFGNKFIVQDGTGRALVETGRRGENGTLVKRGDTVTVQGRFEHGFLHAAVITQPDGAQVLLKPPTGGPGGLAWAKEKVGLGPSFDVAAMTASAERAGFSDIRVTGRGPRHLEMAAKGQDGRERVLHVNVDGKIREE